jgi:hypothetical protein
MNWVIQKSIFLTLNLSWRLTEGDNAKTDLAAR